MVDTIKIRIPQEHLGHLPIIILARQVFLVKWAKQLVLKIIGLFRRELKSLRFALSTKWIKVNNTYMTYDHYLRNARFYK